MTEPSAARGVVVMMIVGALMVAVAVVTVVFTSEPLPVAVAVIGLVFLAAGSPTTPHCYSALGQLAKATHQTPRLRSAHVAIWADFE